LLDGRLDVVQHSMKCKNPNFAIYLLLLIYPNSKTELIVDMKDKIVFMDGFDSVRDAETQSEEIFSTKLPKNLSDLIGERTHIPNEVVDNVVNIYNENGLEDVGNYLLNEGKISQNEREIIVESLWLFGNKNQD
jgi:hypothetical protein